MLARGIVVHPRRRAVRGAGRPRARVRPAHRALPRGRPGRRCRPTTSRSSRAWSWWVTARRSRPDPVAPSTMRRGALTAYPRRRAGSARWRSRRCPRRGRSGPGRRWWSPRPGPVHPPPRRAPPRPRPGAARPRAVADDLHGDVADGVTGLADQSGGLGEQGGARGARPTAARRCRTGIRGRPSPAAESSASQAAWAATSPSEWPSRPCGSSGQRQTGQVQRDAVDQPVDVGADADERRKESVMHVLMMPESQSSCEDVQGCVVCSPVSSPAERAWRPAI